ncbi:MAG: PQQ-binding-like beta-propeller repeat protein [Verrucomicrobiales bacterium]|nr:PQQ-binding-like beta-propeller repeat protein [Verrucomicrobiales bacterium]
MMSTAPDKPSVPEPASPTGNLLAASLQRLARVASVFCIAVGLVLVVAHFRAKEADPFKSTEMAALRRELAAAPKDEALKTHIRELDLALRQQYFTHLSRVRAGAWLLLAGLVTWAVVGRRARKLVEPPHLPAYSEEAAERHLEAAALGRRSVAIAGGVCGLALLGLSMSCDSNLPESAAVPPQGRQGADAPPPGTTPAQPSLPSHETYLANWPRFLGPTGNAVTTHTNVPAIWDVETGENVLWKADVPLPGFNSPIVWGNRIFLCGGDATKRGVFCYDATTGAMLWQQEVPQGPAVTAKQIKELEQTGFSAPSMATDGLRVYAIFATGDLAAFDLAGNRVWLKPLGVPDDPYGHAISLATHEGRLLLQWDQGSEGDEVSKLLLLDGATGEPVWETPRNFGSSWATPVIIDAAGKTQIITVGGMDVVSYNLTDGHELWRLECVGGELTPSPIFAGDLVLATSPSDRVCAIPPDRSGELSEDDLAWDADEEVPDITTPVATEEFLFTLATYGYLVCYDLKNGGKLWDHDLEVEFNATPAIVGNRLYAFSTEGAAFVGEVGREAGEFTRIELGEPIHASPAFAPGRMFVRGEQTLFGIGAKAAGSTEPGTGAGGGE